MSSGRKDHEQEKVGDDDNPAAKKLRISTKEEKDASNENENAYGDTLTLKAETEVKAERVDGTTEGSAAFKNEESNYSAKANTDEDTSTLKAETKVKEEKDGVATDESIAVKNVASNDGKGDAGGDTLKVKAETEVKAEKADGITNSSAAVKNDESEVKAKADVKEEEIGEAEIKEENEGGEVKEENEEAGVQQVQQGNVNQKWRLMLLPVGAGLNVFLTEEDVLSLSGGMLAPFTATDWENNKTHLFSILQFNDGYHIAGGWTQFVEDRGVKKGDHVCFCRGKKDGRLYVYTVV